MSHVDKRLKLLKIQPFRWYVVSCFLAMMGNGLSYVTLTWLLVGEHDALSSVAVLMLCFWIPLVLLSPLGGVLADKFNRKKMMVTVVFIRGLILLLFAWILLGHMVPITMYCLAVLQGICFSFYSPAAMAAVREILPQEDLLHANVLIDIVYEIGNVVGMGAAGFLIHFLTGAGTIMLDGFLFLSAGLALLAMNSKEIVQLVTKEKTGFLANFILGLKYLHKNKTLCAIYIVQLCVLVAFVTSPILSAPYAKHILHATVTQFGIIEALLSLGVVLGGVFSPYVAEKWGLRKVIMSEIFLLASCLVLFSMNSGVYRAEILYFLIGLFLSVWPLIVTRAQELTELDYQGRVHSTFFSISGIIVLIVYFSVNFAGDKLPIQGLYWLQAVMMMGAGCLVWRIRSAFIGRLQT